MRLLISIILIAVLSLGSEYLFPWWSLAIVCFLVNLLMGMKNGLGFLSGFLGILLLWLVVALIRDQGNSHILSARMALLFHVPGSIVFILTGALAGGFAGGMAGWSGALVGRYLLHRKAVRN